MPPEATATPAAPAAPAPAPVSTPTTAPSATPPPSSPAASTPASPALPAATPAASSTAPDPNALQDGNWKQLRERYETAKERAAILDSLGIDASELPNVAKTFTSMRTEAASLAKDLGYDDADFKAAFAKDPVSTLQLLRSERPAAPTSTPPKPNETQADYDRRIEEMVEAKTKPYTEHINQQISQATTQKIGVEFNKAYDAVLPNTPPEVRELVQDYVSEYIIANPNLIVAMKARGDFSSVAETVQLVAGRLQSVFTAWTSAEAKRTGGRTSPVAPGTPNPAPSGRFKLDDLIADPGLLGDAYKA